MIAGCARRRASAIRGSRRVDPTELELSRSNAPIRSRSYRMPRKYSINRSSSSPVSTLEKSAMGTVS